MRTFILKLNCPDAVGLLARITGFIAGSGGNLLEVGQYTDPISRHFFTRLAFTGGLAVEDLAAFRAEFARLAGPLSAEWQVRAADEPVRTVVLVSREDHCLADLLWRWRSRELNIDIAGVLSNHANARGLVEREGIAFEHIDFADRAAAFEGLAARLRALRAELVVLARFMQVLPDALCEEYAGRVINIHHSFLPAFVGANPYRRAFERGVKLIGATSHYVTGGRSSSRRSRAWSIPTTPTTSCDWAGTASGSRSRAGCGSMSRTACWCTGAARSCSATELGRRAGIPPG
jgi:formyltetrahydrofolate deformylase